MGIFNSLFGGNEKKEAATSFLKWIPLTSIAQLEEIKKQSEQDAVLIFKHSTRCIISKMIIKGFKKLFTKTTQSLKVYYLDLLNYRDISNEIANMFGVTHQSPQLIVIKNKKVIHHSSHNGIAKIDLSIFI